MADLEAIRGRIDADRMVLLGHSWGAQVAAGYLAAHPTHVARVMFSSPGALAPALDDGSGASVRTRLTTRQQLGQYLLVARPRVLLGWTLLQVNPQAAHAFVGDAEMDARNDRVYNHGRAGARCRGAPPGPALHGLGFYAFQCPQSAAARPWADPRPQLAHLSTPALVIKGSCDYLSWATGVDYRQELPNAQLVYVHHAGHNAYQDQPVAFLAVVRAFLTAATRPGSAPRWWPCTASTCTRCCWRRPARSWCGPAPRSSPSTRTRTVSGSPGRAGPPTPAWWSRPTACTAPSAAPGSERRPGRGSPAARLGGRCSTTRPARGTRRPRAGDAGSGSGSSPWAGAGSTGSPPPTPPSTSAPRPASRPSCWPASPAGTRPSRS